MSMEQGHILVVEPDEHSASSLARGLLELGVKPHCVPGLAEAELALQERDFQAAFICGDRDTALPTLTRLHELQPACARVLVTRLADWGALVQAINEARIRAVLQRPFRQAALAETLHRVLRDASADRRQLTEQLINSARQERRDVDQLLREQAFRLVAQPIFRLADQHVVAQELLLRPSHPAFQSPLAALEAAQRCDRLHELELAIFQRAAESLPALPEGQRLFINVHPALFADADALRARLAPLNHASHRIVLELTEHVALDPGPLHACAEACTALGYQLALDDLGAGFSSLALLADLDPAWIKLDMSLVRGLGTDARKRRLVQLLLTFAEATGAALIAEGVETPDEAAALTALRVPHVQGYLYGKPKPWPG